MEKNHSQIDIYAIGTNIATCKKQPALGLVCKLTEINKVPKMKFSSDLEKTTLPGAKIVYRIWTNQQTRAHFDLIGLEGEVISLGQSTYFSLSKQQQEKHVVSRIEVMNKPLILSESCALLKSRQYVNKSIEELPESIFKLQQAGKFPVLITEQFLTMLKNTRSANDFHK